MMNLFAVLLATVAGMIVGMIWFSDALFGKQWLAYIGKTKKQMLKENMAPTYALSFVSILLMALVLEYLFDVLGALRISKVLMLASALWLGFVLSTHANESLYGNKPWRILAISVGHLLVQILVMSAILSIW